MTASWNSGTEMQFSSPPIVSHGVVVVGSSLDDNQRVDELRGTVHAFDATTGAPKWSFDPVQELICAQAPPMSGRRCRRMMRGAGLSAHLQPQSGFLGRLSHRR